MTRVTQPLVPAAVKSGMRELLAKKFGRHYMLMLEADRVDASIMLMLSELRQHEDEIDEELRDPERNQYCYIAGQRSVPTAAFLAIAPAQPGEDS